MSICRWSSYDFWCDVYCYESVDGGYSIHVAGNRHVFKEPLPKPVDPMEDMDAYLDRHQEIMRLCDEADRVNIGLSRDGQSFSVDTPDEAADILADLKREGYNVPDDAIAELRCDL